MRLYLSGPITGVEQYRENFFMAQTKIEVECKNTTVINPAELCDVIPVDNMDYEDIMDVCLLLLDKADGIVMLPGWRDSRGAQREYGYALAKDKIILEYQEMVH